MLLEIAQPVSLLLSILSLYSVFHAAFRVPAGAPEQRIASALGLLAVAGALCLVSGLIFRDASEALDERRTPLVSTLPVRLFFWTAAAMLVLFLASWYLETHCVFYRDVRRL